MIAKNFIRHPDAMAVQMVLKFGRPVWNSSRPTTRIGRAIRQAQAAIVKATAQIVQWARVNTPAWFKEKARQAKKLSQLVRASIIKIVWDFQ